MPTLFLIYSYVFIFLLILPAGYAQNPAPVNPIDKEFISDWLVLGPFYPSNLDKDFLANNGGEANAEPKEGDIFIASSGDTLTWKRFSSKKQIIDLFKAVGNYQLATAYAYCTIESNVEGKKYFLIGSDDGVAVWINSEKVHHNNVARQIYIDNDDFAVILKKGSNRCLVKITQGLGKWGFTMRILTDNDTTAITPKFFISIEGSEDQIALSSISWKYHSGDNPQWAKPEYNDHDWELIYPDLRPNILPQNGWEDKGWFRLHIAVDSLLIDKPLGLFIKQAGSSQIYLDGHLIYTISEDKNDWIGLPKLITFENKKNHVIAVRYKNTSVEKYHHAKYPAGFYLQLGNLDRMTNDTITRERMFSDFQVFFTTLPIAIALLHLFLFVFFPGLKQNLYFALFLLAYAATIFFDYESLLAKDFDHQLWSFRMHCASIPFWLTFQLRFVYSLFYEKIPKQFWIIALVAFIMGVLAVNEPVQYFDNFGIIYGIFYLEISRVISLAIYKKQEGAWIIATAFIVFFIFGFMDALMDMGILVALRAIENPYAFGSIAFFVAMSIYLSRDFARANKKIAKQDMEQKLLEAENQRQARELEEARQLQLSMLPRELPEHPQYDLGVYMKTATEVGGDYYDFKQHDDGTLTIVIGDATGHGMQAGTMVAATKSLFNALSEEPEPIAFLKKGSDAIKAMGLKKMYMALTIAKFKDRYMQLSAAGMPFPLIYRSSKKDIEAIPLKGMPLGGFVNFPYQEQNIKLHKGDTVLFMSDGFEEMFNTEDELLGEEKVKDIFREIAIKKPEVIIEHLKKEGEKWANGRDQEDDVTFVVIKIK